MKLRNLVLLALIILLTGGGLIVRFQYSAKFQERLLGHIQRNIEREFEKIDLEAAALIADNASPDSPAWENATHFFILADSSRIVSWNQSQYLPDLATISPNEAVTFSSSMRGDFLIKKWQLPNGTSLLSVLTLADRYPIINNFLSSQWNPSIFPVKDLRIVSPQFSSGESISLGGKDVFRVLFQKEELHESTISCLMLFAAIVLILTGLWRLVGWLEKSLGYDAAFVLLFLGLLGIRLGMIAFSFPSLYFPSDVFDPKRFASSSLNASLGDLYFNATALLILVIYLFLNFRKFRLARFMLRQSGIWRAAVIMICLVACQFALLFPFDFIEAIYHNSSLSLDISQSLSFDTAHIMALAAVLTGCVSSFLFIHVLFSVASQLSGNKSLIFFGFLLGASSIFVLQFYLSGRSLWTTLILSIAFFSVLRISGVGGSVFRASFQLFIYLIFSLVIFSFQNAWASRLFYKERQVQDQFRFGKDFLTDRDVLGEYLLDQARQRIEKDQFIQVRMASLFLSKSAVVDKIRRVHLNNYFDRYEVRITTRSMEEQSAIDADSLEAVQLKNFGTTDYPGIFYAKAVDGGAVKRYHVSIPLHYQRPVGSVELDLSLKRVIPDNVYPELLVDNRFNQIYRNRDFSYAVFTKGKLVSSFGPFNYERDFRITSLMNPTLYDGGLTDSGYNHIGIEDPDGSVAIVSAATYSWFYFITNFSFWFVLGLSLLFIGQGAYGIYSWFRGQQVNYSARIQLFIFLAFLLPVMAVSITTLTLIGRSSAEAIQNDFLERSIGISHRIASLFSIDSMKTNRVANLENWIEENAASSKIDVTVYSPDGKLLATSQPALFDDQLISPLMDREAWKKIALEQEVQTVTNEHIGKLQYSCAYSAVLSPDTGTLEAIVGLPFFESATFLQRSQTLILSNILIVFVVVFILFSLLAFWASRSLTFPIRFITKALGQTTLTGENKPVQWNSSDEIGMLVKEYNRMVENLGESKRALAQSEKEIAWREMAKQVAHEIKNPLTPMKLTLQQMEQALKSGNLPAEKSQKSVEVLLKQVEILNEIAASFSTFASLPAPSIQKVDLRTLLQGAVNLFAADKDGKVTYKADQIPLMVSLDPTSFSRAIANIIINALQARKAKQEVVDVEITTEVKQDFVVISIHDNGKGMSKDVQEKVFQPQFTTKQSGSGLGLAMTKQIIDQAGGRIWFESELGRGTSFFIELAFDKAPK